MRGLQVDQVSNGERLSMLLRPRAVLSLGNRPLLSLSLTPSLYYSEARLHYGFLLMKIDLILYPRICTIHFLPAPVYL